MISAGMGPSLWDRFEAAPGHAEAIDCTRKWLESLPLGLGSDGLSRAIVGQGGALPALSDDLRTAGLPQWADHIASIVGDDRPDGILGKALLFRAGIRVMEVSERDDFLDIAKAALDPLLSSDHRAAVDLAKCFGSNGEARVRLEAALMRLIAEGKVDPNRLALRPRPRELEPADPTTQNLWSSAYATAMVRHGWAYAALRIDPVGYTRLLHALPVGLAHSTVTLSRDFPPDELATMISAAPSTFTADGTPLASGALYALLERAHQTLAKSDQASLASSIEALVKAVLSRVDAPWLGRAWGQRVLWEGSRHDASRSQTWPSLLFDALTIGLDPMPEAESQAWIKAERLDLWHADRVLVEAAILLDHDRRGEALDLLEWGLTEGLVSATGRERALSPGSLEANLLDQIFAGQDLAVWFERIWLAGYAGRERHRIGAYRKIDDTARSTLCWGLAALNCRDLKGRSKIWDAIFLALREIYLLDEEYNWIGDVGPLIFRFAALLCTSLVKQGELAPHRLVAFLDLIVEPTVRFGGFLALMVRQDKAVTLAAATACAPGRVRQALERGVLSVSLEESQLTPNALAGIKTFAAELP